VFCPTGTGLSRFGASLANKARAGQTTREKYPSCDTRTGLVALARISVGRRWQKVPPIHPGEILREAFLVPPNLTLYAVAAALNVPHTPEDIALTSGQRAPDAARGQSICAAAHRPLARGALRLFYRAHAAVRIVARG
jgi:hypothetical protein